MGEPVCKCCGQPMPKPEVPRVSIREILRVATHRAGVSIDEMISSSRKPHVTDWRKAAYAAARQATGASYPKIGRAFNRDHTTVIYGARTADPIRVRAIIEGVAN